MVLVPTDIIYIILNEIKDDTSTLKSTSLVSNTFLQFSQAHLFRRISLIVTYDELAGIEQPFQRLSSALKSNPILGSYIRDLYLSTSGEEIRSLQKNFLSDSVLVPIIRKLSRLHSLTLNVFWMGETPILQSALIDLCRLSSLRCLHLIRCTMFPLIVLVGLPHIRRLSAYETGFGGCSEDEMKAFRRSNNRRGYLEMLEFGNSNSNTTPNSLGDILLHRHSMLSASRLRTLKLNSGKTSIAVEAWNAMRAAAETLEGFMWDSMGEDYFGTRKHYFFDESPIDVAQLPKLTFLGFSFTVGHAVTKHKLNGTWILESLQRMAGQNELKDFVLIFYGRSPAQGAKVEPDGFLSQLDSVLTHGGFPYLTQVAIYIGSEFSYMEGMKTLLLRSLPVLRTTNILSVEGFGGWIEPGDVSPIGESRRFGPGGYA